MSKVRGVYFVQGGDFVKIGHTTDLQRRLLDITNGSPYPLHVALVIRGEGRKLEKALHFQFAEYRCNGEWFYLARPLRNYIIHLGGMLSDAMTPDMPIRAFEKMNHERAAEGISPIELKRIATRKTSHRAIFRNVAKRIRAGRKQRCFGCGRY